MNVKRILITILVLFFLINVIPFASAAEKNGPRKTIQVAYLERFYPFQQRGENGEEGFIIDLLKEIERIEPISFQFHGMKLEEAVLALESGEVDAIAGLKYTSERDEKFDFSQPFTTVSHSLFVPVQNSAIHSLPDLGGKIVAVERGDVALEILQDIRGVEVIVANDPIDAFKLLQSGRADAFLGNSLFAQAYLYTNNLENAYRKTNDLLLPSDYAFVTREGNRDIMDKIDTGLIKIRANQDYQRIYNTWFGWANDDLTRQMRRIIQILLITLGIIVVYFVLTMRWNHRLKEEVYKRTVELEKTNAILHEKIEEEQRLREKLIKKEKMQALGQLAAGIAHELRNPLTSIKAFVELIPDKFDNQKFREEVFRFVPAEINRLNKLLTNLLDYARPQEPHKENIAVADLLDSVVPLFQVQWDKKAIRCIREIPSDLYVFADYGQMKQVLVNLLLNAMDAIGQKGTIRIAAKEKGSQVSLFIEDSGKGIPADKIDSIFDPFYTDKKDGTGLGLPLSLQYMKENDGDLQVRSQSGRGTVVTMILPKGERPE